MEKGTLFNHTSPPQAMLPIMACSPCHQLSLHFQLFFLFALMAARSSFGKLLLLSLMLLWRTCILSHEYYWNQRQYSNLVIMYIYPITHSSYHGSIVFKTVFDFSQYFHHFCFDQWCNLLTSFSIL